MNHCKRFLTVLLAFCLLLGCLPVFSASAAGDAMSNDAVRELLNGVELHPQRTGYPELDKMLEDIFVPYQDSDNYTKLKAAYDWTIRNINYSWAPYSQNWAPAYDCFVPRYDLAYEEGLQEAMPWEIVNRTYHSVKYREGICYDYAAVFAVMARYLGFEAFVHTGYFVFEAGYGTGSGHHGWAEVRIDGVNYIFDPQRDYRMSANGTAAIPDYYFGIPMENAWRYSPETEVNAARDAGFLPVTAEREQLYTVRVEATASGTARGTGRYPAGTEVTVTAQGEGFRGWYDEKGRLCSAEADYTFTAQRHITLRAVFDGEMFADVSANAWYYADVTEAERRGIVNGTQPFTFNASGTLTRAMAASILARAENVQTSADEAPFADIPANAWYAGAVAWSKEAGVINGIGKNLFYPNVDVTREQFVTMLMRYAAFCGKSPEETELPYTDLGSVSAFALTAMRQAQTVGLIGGYRDGTFRPQNSLARAEGVTMLMRLVRWLETE